MHMDILRTRAFPDCVDPHVRTSTVENFEVKLGMRDGNGHERGTGTGTGNGEGERERGSSSNLRNLMLLN